MIHLDYSENYDSKLQSEIQSVYFGHSSFSIFTGCSYYKEHLAVSIQNPLQSIMEEKH